MLGHVALLYHISSLAKGLKSKRLLTYNALLLNGFSLLRHFSNALSAITLEAVISCTYWVIFLSIISTNY